jgi:integrase/recombinase XerD
MTIKRAKILSQRQLTLLVKKLEPTENFVRDKVMLLFSYKAGLRAAEIAGLEWEDLVDAEQRIHRKYFIVRSTTTKTGCDRKIPMNDDLRVALLALREHRPNDLKPMYATFGGYMTANNLTVYMWRLYRRAGFSGVSSHSGRRTFITTLARKANNFGCSLKDVQRIAGHARMTTTELYIEPSTREHSLVNSL